MPNIDDRSRAQDISTCRTWLKIRRWLWHLRMLTWNTPVVAKRSIRALNLNRFLQMKTFWKIITQLNIQINNKITINTIGSWTTAYKTMLTRVDVTFHWKKKKICDATLHAQGNTFRIMKRTLAASTFIYRKEIPKLRFIYHKRINFFMISTVWTYFKSFTSCYFFKMKKKKLNSVLQNLLHHVSSWESQLYF